MLTVRMFKQYIHVPFVLLAAVEGLLLFGSFYVGAQIPFVGDVEAADLRVGELARSASVFAAVMIVGMSSVGLYQLRPGNRGQRFILRVGAAFTLGWVSLSVLSYVLPQVSSGWWILLLSSLLAMGLVMAVRPLFYRVLGDQSLKRRVLVLGAGRRAAALLAARGEDVRVAGCVPCGPGEAHVDRDLVVELESEALLDFCLARRIEEIVVAPDERRNAVRMDELLHCKLAGISVLSINTYYERQEGRVCLDFLYPGWLVFSDGCTRTAIRLATKRVFDIVVSLALLIVTLPLMLLTALAIKLEEGWRAPLFYRQRRVGVAGEEFYVFKFRSMRTDAEKDGKARWAQQRDDRVTRVGRVTRALRIDELPQILNVLRGEMSFVGPRPERPEFVRELGEQIPYYQERHCLKPGITGWAQVRYPYGASLEDSRAKLEYDLFYIKNHTLLLDLYILLCTVEVVIFGRGR